MAHRVNDNASEDFLEPVLDQGLSGLPEALTRLINQAMFIERERHLKADHYERAPKRAGYANGYKSKQLKTRVGKLDLLVPQTREGDFYPSCIERGMRSERAVKLLWQRCIFKMYQHVTFEIERSANVGIGYAFSMEQSKQDLNFLEDVGLK